MKVSNHTNLHPPFPLPPLPSHTPFLPFPSPPLRSRAPLSQLRGFWERCKPQRSTGRSPGRKRIWCTWCTPELSESHWWQSLWVLRGMKNLRLDLSWGGVLTFPSLLHTPLSKNVSWLLAPFNLAHPVSCELQLKYLHLDLSRLPLLFVLAAWILYTCSSYESRY